MQWAVWAVLMTAVMGWLARSRQRPRPASEAGYLAHPSSTLIVGVAIFVLFAGFAILSNVYANETSGVLTTCVFVAFAVLPLWMVADYFLERHHVSDQGLSYRDLMWRPGRLAWPEVTRVGYAPAMKWFRIETRGGKVARVSAMLVGLPEFARLVLAHVPRTAINAASLPVLEATAAGSPPSLWA